jgi:hypothetical protein
VSKSWVKGVNLGTIFKKGVFSFRVPWLFHNTLGSIEPQTQPQRVNFDREQMDIIGGFLLC